MVVGCTLLAVWTGGGHLTDGIVDTADFEDYCAGSAWWSGATDGPWPRRRSVLAGMAAGLLTIPLGIVDGLAAAGVIGFAGVAAGVLLAGRAILGPVAGSSAAVLTVALAPLAILPRHLSFYPAIVGVFSLAAGLVACAARSRARTPWLLGCLGVAICPLIDLRGIVWGGALGLVMLAAALRRPERLRLAAVLLGTVALSWGAGQWAYPGNAASLEEQAWQAIHLQQFAAQQAQAGSVLPVLETWTVWGRSPLLELPAGLLTVAQIADQAPARSGVYAMSDSQLQWWTVPMLVSAALVAWRLRRDGWGLVVLLGIGAPFWLAWSDGVRFGHAELRQVALGAPGTALLVGAGIGALWPTARRWWLAPAVLAVLVLPQMPLGPDADWRRPTPSRQQHHIAAKLQLAAHGHIPRARLGGACVRALVRDRDAGRPAGSRLYGPLTGPTGSPPGGPGPMGRPVRGTGQ